MEQLRILVVDEHQNVRTSLAARLKREPDFDIICQAEDSEKAIECAIANQPDIILIDPMMRDGQGMEAIQRIKSGLPATRIVVLTAFVDTSLLIELRKIGVTWVLEKNLDLNRLIAILREEAAAI